MKKLFYLLALCIALSTAGVKGQVLIGENADPQPFSILELESGGERGLRIPQLTEAERNTLTGSAEFQEEKTGKAKGLVIYNKDTDALEYWNGEAWVSF